MQLRVLSFLLLVAVSSLTAEECLSRDYGLGGTVCVCNAEHCDTIPRPEKVEEPKFLVYTSNKAGLRFSQETGEFTSVENGSNQLHINSEVKYQTVLGFGGAFTDSTGINIASLEEGVQEKLLRSYFSEDGIVYSLCRVPIGGSDFSTRGYSYDDGDVDLELANFALAEEDFKYKIPYMKQALQMTDNNLEFFASAWGAPKWMKTNGEYAGFGFLKEEMYQSWADYFVKFLDNYQAEGIDFWGITTGNEPHAFMIPGNQINNVGWLGVNMGNWILNNLGPAIRNSNHSDIKLMVLDDNRVFLPWVIDLTLADNDTRQYIDGIAVHWYIDVSPVSSPDLLGLTHDHFPEKFILYTEASNGQPVSLGSWERGEQYSSNIIEDVSNWVGGWVDWNMVLDLTGGPTYIDNFLDSPIIVNATAGEFYKQPMFYHLGHFSKFVPKNSVRIESNLETEADVVTVAFQTPDDAIVVVILNKEEEVVPISLIDSTRGTAQLELSEKSITTVLYW